MSQETCKGNIPDLCLERYRLGESDPQEAVWIERMLQEDDALRARLDALEASDRSILAQHPSLEIGARLRALLGRRTRSTDRDRRAWVLRLAPIAVLLFLAVGLPIALSVGGTGSDERAKGPQTSLFAFRKTENGAERLATQSRVSAGEWLRLGYRVAEPGYGVIVSLDGRGEVSQHLPERGISAARLETKAVVLLDFALELDDVPGYERFFLVTSEQPFSIDVALRAAEVLGGKLPADPDAELELPASLAQVVLSLRKE